ncbi:MAG: phosphocholine cytidylyltransferase family protein [Defluviitaleaceae bacterium]|nr:phosphocholine cytidylyltransferase family protein [Defluviitaleaceae bacterium]
MKAIILAAGRGSRMGEGTADIPKCLITLKGRTLLDWGLNSLKEAGFKHCDIGIVTGYKKEKINIKGVRYFHNDDWENTNMFVSLTRAREWLINEPCIVCYSDIVYSAEAIKRLVASKYDIGITYYTGFWELWQNRFKNPLDDLETFKLCEGKLIEIGNKPVSRDEICGQYMGLLRFSPMGWEQVEDVIKLPMKKPVCKLDMTALLQHLLELGIFVGTIACDEPWLECDNMDDLKYYES